MKRHGTGFVSRVAIALLALVTLGPAARGQESPGATRGVSLGVTTQILGEDWRGSEAYFASGVMVTAVAPGSAAERGGLAPGDILVSVGSRALHSPDDLVEVESGVAPGDAVPVVVAREAGRMIRIFNLETGPGPQAPESEASGAGTTTAARHATVAGLGVTCEDLDWARAAELGVPEGLGVLVQAVNAGSPAEAAGIETGDVITWAADQPVTNVDRLQQIVALAPSPLAIVTVRSGTTRPVTAEFQAAAPAKPVAAAPASAAGATDPQVAALREEVRSLREELRKLREELASLKESASRR